MAQSRPLRCLATGKKTPKWVLHAKPKLSLEDAEFLSVTSSMACAHFFSFDLALVFTLQTFEIMVKHRHLLETYSDVMSLIDWRWLTAPARQDLGCCWTGDDVCFWRGNCLHGGAARCMRSSSTNLRAIVAYRLVFITGQLLMIS